MKHCGSLHEVADRVVLWCTRDPAHDGLHAHGRNVWARGDTITESGIWWFPMLPPANGWRTIGTTDKGFE